MKLKAGITIEGLKQKVREALPILEKIFQEQDIELVVTSTTDDYPPRSTPDHREGWAVDLRARQVNPYLLPLLRRNIERAFPGAVTVHAVLVYPDIEKSHIHVTFKH